MMAAKLFSHLKPGDLIIVRGGGDAPVRVSPHALSRAGESPRTRRSSRLLRALAALRKQGKKK
jgi:hypothetical protein